MDIPKVGDIIYVDTHRSLSHGFDDFHGGKATVTTVKIDDDGIRIEVAEDPGTLSGWHYLGPLQPELKAKFGDTWAYLDPDHRPQFNDLGTDLSSPDDIWDGL